MGRTLWGQALRAAAVNRFGARLVGIRTETAGALAFTFAALIGALLRNTDRARYHPLL